MGPKSDQDKYWSRCIWWGTKRKLNFSLGKYTTLLQEVIDAIKARIY